ncbi:hypothetical protein AB3U43_00405 (plasmid) [Bacillus cereus]|uniref:hypothetical protein n=1 Tax=Bacillus cereus TaxID=1396 RepID=UPI0034CE88BE
MNSITIEQIYQEILDGKRKRFPPNTWNKDIDFELSKRVTKYLIKHVLQWDRNDIRKGWNQRLIQKMKLTTVLSKYNSSPYAMLNDAFPNCIKEWELGMAPINFWTKLKALEALKWTIEEKENLKNDQILCVFGEKWLKKNKLNTPCGMYWNGSPYAYLNELYPNQFKEWQLKKVPMNFWTQKNALDILQWTIENKEYLSEEQLLNVFDKSWLSKHRLSSPCKIFWANSPYAMLNALYPNRFKEWQLKKVPMNFWTRKNSLEALKWTIEVKEKLSDVDIKKIYSIVWLNQQNLRTPIIKFWKDSPYAYLNALYPEKFKEWELISSPNRFWTKQKALEALRWTIEVKEKLTHEELKEAYNRKWIKKNKLNVPLNKFFGNSPYRMLNTLYPGRFKGWELSVTPYNYWTKKRALEALRWTIEIKEKLTDEELLKIYTCKWIIKNGLKTPLEKFWNSSSYAMLDDLYPNRFSKKMLKGYRKD